MPVKTQASRTQATRSRIVETADNMFYQQGFGATSFADISAAIGISRGNFYHHFKTKDEILAAVIDHRMEKTRGMLAEWESENTHPADRICAFIRILLVNQALIEEHGCPVGTLVSEMAKIDHRGLIGAREIFDLFRNWLEQQFAALGAEQPDELAMRVLAFSQGMASLSTAYRDHEFVSREVTRLCNWVRRGAVSKFRETI